MVRVIIGSVHDKNECFSHSCVHTFACVSVCAWKYDNVSKMEFSSVAQFLSNLSVIYGLLD